MGKDVSIDVGGTFTDFVAYDRDTSKLTVWKTLSTPDDRLTHLLRCCAAYLISGRY